MIKCQSFGFDLLLIMVAIAFFSQLMYYSFMDNSSNYFLQRSIENHELLRAALMRNNSLAYLDCYVSFNNLGCLAAFNESIAHSLESYLGSNRNYLLRICGLDYFSNESHKCFSKALPYYLNITDIGCEAYFSIYDESEVIDCA
jgi:hypothetical protein